MRYMVRANLVRMYLVPIRTHYKRRWSRFTITRVRYCRRMLYNNYITISEPWISAVC